MSHSSHPRKPVDVPHFKHPSFMPWVKHLRLYQLGEGVLPDFKVSDIGSVGTKFRHPRTINSYELEFHYLTQFKCTDREAIHGVLDATRLIGELFYKDLIDKLLFIRRVYFQTHYTFDSEVPQCLGQLIDELADMSRLGYPK